MILAVLMLTICVNAQTLKSFTIGEKLIGIDTIITTVAQIPGIVTVDTLDDGIIYSIGFIPSDDGQNVSRVYKVDVDRLVSELEINFNIVLVPLYDKHDYLLRYNTKDMKFIIKNEYNQYMDRPYKLTLRITNKELNKIREVE